MPIRKSSQKLLQRLATSGRHNSAMITDRRKIYYQNNPLWDFSFHFYLGINSPLECTLRARNLPKIFAASDAGLQQQITLTSLSRT